MADDKKIPARYLLQPEYFGLNVKPVSGNERTEYIRNISDGILDVTKYPFYADNKGESDVTGLLQLAIQIAQAYQLVCFFPKGCYLVSNTLLCRQKSYVRFSAKDTGKTFGSWFHPCCLRGEKGSTLVLKAQSFTNAEAPQPVVKFVANSQFDSLENVAGDNFNQCLLDIDIEMKAGNAGAVGLYHIGAQNSLVCNVRISGEDAYAGIVGGASGGGGVIGVTVTGCRYGIYIPTSIACPAFTDLTLINQTEMGIYFNGTSTLCVTGACIEQKSPIPAVYSTRDGKNAWFGSISLKDVSIDYGSAIFGEGQAIRAGANLYMENVHVRGISTVVGTWGLGNKLGAYSFSVNDYLKPWCRIKKLCYAMPETVIRNNNVTHAALYNYRFSLIRNNVVSPDQYFSEYDFAAEVPEDIRARHSFFSYALRDSAFVNAKEHGAKGDGTTDDTNALESILKSYDKVFLPKGIYCISRPLDMKEGQVLVGVAGSYAVLYANANAVNFSEGDAPILRTSKAANHLQHFGLHTPTPAVHVYHLQWDCKAPQSSILGVSMITWPTGYGYGQEREHPQLVINGAGRFSNLNFTAWGYHKSSFTHIQVCNASDVHLYNLNLEHARSQSQMNINDSSRVYIYSLKTEGNYPIIRMQGCTDMALYGYGGHAVPLEQTSLVYLQDCTNIMLANMNEAAWLPGTGSDEAYAGRGVNPYEWTTIECTKGEATWVSSLTGTRESTSIHIVPVYYEYTGV